MSRRVVRTILAAVCLAVLVFAVPLAVAVSSLYHGEATQQLVNDAAEAATSVSPPRIGAGDPVDLAASADGAAVALYGRDGARLAGDGPARADAVVRTALGGHIGSGTGGMYAAAAVPVGAQEQVVGAVRTSLPMSSVDARVHRAWLVMGGIAVAAIAVAAGLGLLQARRLARPLEVLDRAAARLGDGDFTVRLPPSGIAEADSVAVAMNRTAARLGRVLERERAFSADASHQLRTPLTALRVRLESAAAGAAANRRELAEAALGDVTRLEAIVENLLRLARDAPIDREAVEVAPILLSGENGWRSRLAPAGRPLRLEIEVGVGRVAASASAVREIVEVLVDNAVVHGAGTVLVRARRLHGMAAVEVSDEGGGVAPPLDRVFARRASGGAGTGIGLALARSLAEAEGGRLLIAETGNGQVFQLLLRRAEETEAPE